MFAQVRDVDRKSSEFSGVRDEVPDVQYCDKYNIYTVEKNLLYNV